MSKLYMRSSLSAVGLLLAVALAAACADDPARSTMPTGRSHGLVTFPGDNPDPGDPSTSEYAVKSCTVTDVVISSTTVDGQTVQPNINAGVVESYGAVIQGVDAGGHSCFPEPASTDSLHRINWQVGQWGQGEVAKLSRVSGLSNDFGYVTGLKVGRGTLAVSVKDLVAGTVKTITHTYFLDVVGPSRVVVTPASFSVLNQGGTYQLGFTAYDRRGQVIPGRTANWQSSAWSIASVSATGLVTGGTAGSVTITATVDGVPATSAGTVRSISCTDCTPWVPVG